MIWLPAGIAAAKTGNVFSPPDIAGLELWLDASNSSSITETSGEVSNWSDESGEGNDVAQATAANQPNTSTINGNSSVFFDGENTDTEHLDNLSVSLPTETTTVAVVFTPTIVTGSDDRLINLREGFNDEFRIRRDEDDITPTVGRGAGNVTVTLASVLTADTTAWVIVRARATGAGACDFLMDDGTSSSGTLGQTPPTADRLCIGGRDNGTNAWAGHIHEVIKYDTFISDVDRTTLENYINNKWSIG